MRICALPHRLWSPRVKLSATLAVGRDAIDLPRQWREASHVFLQPHRDVFELPEPIIESLFEVMSGTRRHEFQLTTLHPDRAVRMPKTAWAPNIWVGALIVGDEDSSRLEALKQVPCAVHFAHLRPSAAVPTLDLAGLDFVVVEHDGEPSGLPALEEQCEASGLRLFMGRRAQDAETRVDNGSALMRRATHSPRRG